jgi:hypothetical protein
MPWRELGGRRTEHFDGTSLYCALSGAAVLSGGLLAPGTRHRNNHVLSPLLEQTQNSGHNKRGTKMIRVALQRSRAETIYIEFDAVPLEKEDDFRCITDGEIGFEAAKQISVELHQGHVKGHIDGHHWYRQAGS